MVLTVNRKLAAIILVVGLLSIVLGGVFIGQGFAKSNMIASAMTEEQIKYNAADGSINGIIDTPHEATAMAGILKEHRMNNYGIYSELSRDDPNRDQILKAMTMENSLNLAQMGYGLTDVVKISGVWMIIIGVTFAVMSLTGLRSRKKFSMSVSA